MIRHRLHKPVYDVQLCRLDVAHAAHDEVKRRRRHVRLERDVCGITPRALITLHKPCIAFHKERRREFEQMLWLREVIVAGDSCVDDARARVKNRVDNTAEDLQNAARACHVVFRHLANDEQVPQSLQVDERAALALPGRTIRAQCIVARVNV